MGSYVVNIVSDDNAHTTFVRSLLPECIFSSTNPDTIIFVGGNEFKISRRGRPQIIGINISIESSMDIHKGKYDVFDHIFLNDKKHLVRLQRKLGTKYVHYLPDLDSLNKIDMKVGKRMAISDDFNPGDYKFDDDVETISFDSLHDELPRSAICSTKDQVLYCMNSSTPFVLVSNEIDKWVNDLLGSDFIIDLKDDAIAYLISREADLKTIIIKIYSNCHEYWNTKQLIGIVQSMDKRRPIFDHVDSVQIDTIHASYLRLRDYLEKDGGEIDLNRLVSFIGMKIDGDPVNDKLLDIITNNPDYLLDRIREFKRQFSRKTIKECNRLTVVHHGKLRLGWDEIMKYLSSITCDNGILFDPCIDDTFKSSNVLETSGVIPYTVPWIGIIHDPVDQLCLNPLFIKSIITCQALICFTDIIYDELQNELNLMKDIKRVNHDIDLIKLVHPTCLPDITYSCAKPTKILCFENSQNQLSFDFCKLGAGSIKKVMMSKRISLPEVTRYDIEKSELDGTLLSSILKYINDNNFLCSEFGMTYSDVPKEFSVEFSVRSNARSVRWIIPSKKDDDDLVVIKKNRRKVSLGNKKEVDSGDGDKNDGDNKEDDDGNNKDSSGVKKVNMSGGGSSRRMRRRRVKSEDGEKAKSDENSQVRESYTQKLKDHIQSILLSCDYVTDEDVFTDKSMVFMDVDDTTGIQYPMIECIMANIPFLIRNTPTTVEYLGERYPLYIKDDHINNSDEINKAHIYLKTMNKHQFMIENFVNQIKDCTFYKTMF
uniref:Uncharacterized protein n=1 Tax=Pithovirus LCPAC403 TaxID=2506596 RepID=A0A481ZBF4_9VIRU|nr:MAG: uncharacterized protein LCPAC403_03970 [Pithovirus LCPAC403]